MDHLTDERAGLFLSGRMASAERRAVVRHLLGGCEECRDRLAAYTSELAGVWEETWREPAEPELDAFGAYDEALDRAVEAALEREAPRWERERRLRNRLMAKARAHEDRLAGLFEALPEKGRHTSWAAVEALVELAQEERFRDCRRMLDLAFAAVAAAKTLSPKKYGEARVADLEGRAWAELGNARRLNDDFPGAEAAFSEAARRLSAGTGDLLTHARLLDLEASLRSSQRRLADALEILDLLVDVYERLGETRLAGRALISKGINTHYDGRPAEAVELLRAGLDRVDRRRDTQLVAIGREALLHALTDAGRFPEAARLVLAGGLREAFRGEPINLLRLRWVEAKVYAGLGRLHQAERVLRQVRDAFLARGMEYDAALVGLELSGVLLRLGEKGEARDFAVEVLEVFQDLEVHREAVRAVYFLREACEQEVASPAMVDRVLGFVRRLEWEPRLRFAP
jgi:tetratricopeptide (TPR) repeat protein